MSQFPVIKHCAYPGFNLEIDLSKISNRKKMAIEISASGLKKKHSLVFEDLSSTVNVDIFTLYIFSLNSRFLNIRENIYTTIILSYRAICR